VIRSSHAIVTRDVVARSIEAAAHNPNIEPFKVGVLKT
jgi:hypothetical protein